MGNPGKTSGKILERFAERALFNLLSFCRWKRQIVHENRSFACNETPEASDLFYRQMLMNLTHHVSEILFRFGLFKNTPSDTGRYPFQSNGITYKLADGSIPVLQKMRSGGIFLTAHFGDYEAIGPWLCRLGIPLKASYIPLKPKWLNRIVEKRMRAVDGKSYSINAKNPREFLRLLDEGQLFCLLMDQDSRIASAIETTFLGKNVHANPLPDFLLKHRPHTPVFICWLEEDRQSRILHAIEVECKGRFRIKSGMTDCEAGFPINSGMTNSEAIQPATTATPIADAFNRWLEKRIADNPALWYGWTHRRFYSSHPEIYR